MLQSVLYVSMVSATLILFGVFVYLFSKYIKMVDKQAHALANMRKDVGQLVELADKWRTAIETAEAKHLELEAVAKAYNDSVMNAIPFETLLLYGVERPEDLPEEIRNLFTKKE